MTTKSRGDDDAAKPDVDAPPEETMGDAPEPDVDAPPEETMSDAPEPDGDAPPEETGSRELCVIQPSNSDMVEASEKLHTLEELDAEPLEMEFVMPLMGSYEKLSGLFNTFRLGTRWMDLLSGSVSVGTLDELRLTVLAPDSDKRVTMDGISLALSVHHGTLGDMLDMHVGLTCGLRSTMPADRKLELRDFLSRVYGRRASDSDKCTVIYIARMQ